MLNEKDAQFSPGIARPQFAVTADGQRFLLNTLSDGANLSPITVVVNWAGRARDGTAP